jgi:Mn-dependent DtxR family transcriptional regulator
MSEPRAGDVTEDRDILRIVKEDILRMLAEKRNKKSLLGFIRSEIKSSPSFISEATCELEKEDLVRVVGDYLELTEKGKDRASDILEKHLTVERYFRRSRSKGEAHEAAQILEHYVSQEVIDNMKELSTLKKEGVPLSELKANREAMITNITFPDSSLFERLISMGIVPGERIKVTNRIGHTIIANVNKTFALGEEIARKIEVLEHERT